MVGTCSLQQQVMEFRWEPHCRMTAGPLARSGTARSLKVLKGEGLE